MKKRRIKIKPLPPELASAAKRKALFAALVGEEGTPHAFLQINAYPWQKPNAAKGLSIFLMRADEVAATPTLLRPPGRKRGPPKGNSNALRHGRFTAKRLAARAQVRRIVAQVDFAIALALSPCSDRGES